MSNAGEEQILCIKDKKQLLLANIAERSEIELRAHLLGHFQQESTLKRIHEEYHWKIMRNTVEQVIASCVECMRHHKELEKSHDA